MHLALIADSHLSERAPECVSNWRAAARAVAMSGADLTIHLGDITLDGERRFDEISFAAGLIRHWPTPMCCVLGNHDMGTGSGEQPLHSQAHSRCVAAFGLDRWKLSVQGWTLIGINAQLLGTDSVEASAQHDWVHEVAQRLTKADRVALFIHRPVKRPSIDEGMLSGRYVPTASARWLLDGPLRSALRLVVSGHTHQALDFTADGVRHIWVPSSSFVISDALQKPVGKKVVGLGWLDLDPGRFEYMQLATPGAVEHELTRLGFYNELAH
jgi:predicted phosphodiesterase